VSLKVSNLSITSYLLPGLVCFLIFTILPMAFTIAIAFTNLSTGHFLSVDKVRELLLSETLSPEDSVSVPVQVFDASGVLAIKADSLMLPATTDLTNARALGPLEIQKRWSELERLEIHHPEHGPLLFYRTDELRNLKHRFSASEADQLFDHVSGHTFAPNLEVGRYVSLSDPSLSLAPGFSTWVGFKNLKRLFFAPGLKDSFLKVLIWTFFWAGLSVTGTFFLGISLALIMNDKNLKMKALYRNLFILPYSIPFFISVLIFKGLLNKDFGQINSLLSIVNLGPIPWLEHAWWAKLSALMVNLWLGFPYMFLVTTGILQSIPHSLYEAAHLEGVSRAKIFRHITLPLVMSAIAPLLIGSFAFNMNNFVGIYLLTGGGPPMPGSLTPVGETDILISYTYRLAFEGGQGQDFALASTIALFIFVIVATLTAINYRFIMHRKAP
jgi:maltose/maltodextrin transport system permease protein